MFREFLDRYEGGELDPVQTAFAPATSFSDAFKSVIHAHSCACVACYQQKLDDAVTSGAGSSPPSGPETGSDTSTQGRLSPGANVIDEINQSGDSDWFSINLIQGEVYTFTVYLPPGGLPDSVLTLRDLSGNEIVTNDDANSSQFLYYSEITFTANRTGTYFLDVSGFGANSGVYVLSSSRPLDDAVGNTNATASQDLALDGSPIFGVLEETGDRDWYAVTLVAGETYVFETSDTGGLYDVDTILSVRDASGEVQAYNDDSLGIYSSVRFTPTQSGTYYIDVGGWADGEEGTFQISAGVAGPLQEYTNDQIAQQLLLGSSGNPSNLRRWDAGEGDTLTVDVSTLTAEGQFLAREALALWSDATGIRFVEVTSGAQITFQDTDSGAYAQTIRTNGFITSSTVNVSTDWLNTYDTGLDSYSFQTYVHEVGHALGLRHGGDYNAQASYDQDALYANDSWATTVMSYFDQVENDFFNDLGFSRQFAVTPMSADIVAVQQSYGAVTTTRTGDTVYGVGNTSGRASLGVGNAATDNFGNLLAFVIIDNGGVDTVNYSTFSSNQLINLEAESFSNVGGSVGNMSIARGTVIENAVAGRGNDTLIGNDTANRLTGGLGNDTLDGGSNVDTAVVSGNRSFYSVTQISTGVFRVVGADGMDTLTGVEFLQFDDETLRLRPGTGVSVDFSATNPAAYQSAMSNIKDFDGNSLGGDGFWLRIGEADVNGDGDIDQILVNDNIARFATVGTAEDGLIYFDDHSWAGETRVAGIYIDPLVEAGIVDRFSDFDSQQRFQNDLAIENINRVLGADDYDGDGLQEVYFALTDGTAYLRAIMEFDGNIRYANYQSEQQVIDYLTANGYDASTWDGWFTTAQEAPAPNKLAASTTHAAPANASVDDAAIAPSAAPITPSIIGPITLTAIEDMTPEFFG
ncbi:MAG: M10 family metallopeptidase C-terminal domain-containing protein [Erythrobacter sp.]|uniref:M10 family metallopeptidase C-terminal domain-containing protein n=1 Tax=Erythrobacter sp. TaxID=1042 RepID=UPI002634D0CB|nr:M10 family metallopeptidase C-terminal domain-containing protein [Erythrobacter sp.]MDJ0979009.1 M10 family metallopeptidase C-terminal domain-containing protein [Erythrobacter sp.]